jgi:AbrB family looped-hinge helix DNA binding protein
MDAARLSAKGQVTIPIGIRRRLGFNAGENVIFIEESGNVFITSERGLSITVAKVQPEKQTSDFPYFFKDNKKNFTEPEQFLPKDKRREILTALYGSTDDPTLIEPFGVEIESPRDWEMIN